MHAVLITFTTAATDAALAGPFARFAELLRDVPGFGSKVWLRDGDMRGGFYLFADEAAARAYVDGPVVAAVRANPVFADVHVCTFDVDTDLSARTGVRAHAPV
jgi:hypothetical protein